MLSKKAKKFIHKYQQGSIVPGSNMYSMVIPQIPSLPLGPVSSIRDLSPKLTPPTVPNQPNQPNQPANTPGFLDQAIPFIGPGLKLITGGINLVESFQKKKRQKIYDQQSKEATKEAFDRLRYNNFYKTPYTYQQGGLIDQVQQQVQQQTQEMQEMQDFAEYYNQNAFDQTQQFQNLRQSFQNKNEQKKLEWEQQQKQGISGLASGALGVATQAFGIPAVPGFQQGGVMPESTYVSPNPFRAMLNPTLTTGEKVNLTQKENIKSREDALLSGQINMSQFVQDSEAIYGTSGKIKSKDRYREKQDGGEIDPISNQYPTSNPNTTDLYSPEFDPQAFLGIQKNEVEADKIEEQEMDTMMDWVFSDEGFLPEEEETNDRYFGGASQGDTSLQVGMRNLNPGNIKYGKFAEKYGAVPGTKATDGGVFATFPSIEVGLRAHRDLLKGSGYTSLTVDKAMRRWSNNGYGGEIYPELSNKRMYELDDKQMAELQKRQIKIETPQAYKQIYE